MSKLMFRQGNLFTGSPYGVRVKEQFDSTELHGPFSSENEAWNYGMGLARESDGTRSFDLVKIETPGIRSIATAQEVRAHRAEEAPKVPEEDAFTMIFTVELTVTKDEDGELPEVAESDLENAISLAYGGEVGVLVERQPG